MAGGTYRKSGDLPQLVPVFPLDGALLLPRAMLPLNVFEPRYLNMIDDAMSGDRIIAMIQTRPGGGPTRPRLADVGCAGRITSYAETPDGRYLITLTGLSRFRAGDELPVHTPYRQVRADFSAYEEDLQPSPELPPQERAALMGALKAYLESRGLDIDWTQAGDAPLEALINSLSMALPFEPAEKQALIEAPTLQARLQALFALMAMGAAGSDDDDSPMQ